MDDNSFEQQDGVEQNTYALLTELVQEIRDLRGENVKLHERLTHMESALERLNRVIRKSAPPSLPDTNYETIDKFITEQIQQNLVEQQQQEEQAESDETEVNWSYVIAQKGGYDDVLYMTVQDFFKLKDEEPAHLVRFLMQKRDQEVEESLRHLQDEYENLEGNTLQHHFTELWQLHHNILKKKIIRTWKEEIFLQAFEEFLKSLQQGT